MISTGDPSSTHLVISSKTKTEDLLSVILLLGSNMAKKNLLNYA